MFGDFLNAAKAFLKANPGEVLLVRHQMEHSDDNDAYAKAWAGYYNTTWSDKPWSDEPVPQKFAVIQKSPGISSTVTLGQVRGRILFHHTIEMGFGDNAQVRDDYLVVVKRKIQQSARQHECCTV